MKNLLFVFSLALLLCIASSCQNKAEKAELEKFRTQAKLEEQNKEIAKRFFEEINKGNLEIIDEFCAPDYRYYFPSDNPKPMSREEQIETEKMIRRSFPDISLRVEGLFAVEDSVVIRGVATATHQGEFQGIQATGRKIEFSNVTIMRLRNGKIVETRGESNMLGFMEQLGMEFKPKQVKK